MARHHSLLFLALSTLLPGCSRSVTCVLEGCAKNDSVVMSDDLKPKDADATASKKDDLTQTVEDILDRMGAVEALTKLMDATVKLHEGRLAGLEKRASALEESMKSTDAQIAHLHDEMLVIQDVLPAMEARFNESLEKMAEENSEQLDLLKTDINTKLGMFEGSLDSLDETMKGEIKTIVDAMADQRKELDKVDGDDRKAAADALKALGDELKLKIADLVDADCDIRKELADQISQLDDKVDTVAASGILVAVQLWAQLGKLQLDLKAVELTNKLDRQAIWSKINSVESKLNTEVTRLNSKDLSLYNDIVALRGKQQQTESDLQTLKTRVDNFISTQTNINTKVDSELGKLATGMTSLKTTLEAQIDDAAEDIKEIMKVLLPSLTSRVDQIQTTSIPNLQKSLSDLEKGLGTTDANYLELKGTVESMDLEFTTKITDLTKDVGDLETAMGNLESCTIGDKYKEKEQGGGNSWYQDLTCGTSVIKIQVK